MTPLARLQAVLYYDVRNASQEQFGPHQQVFFGPYISVVRDIFRVWQASKPDASLVRFQLKTGVTPDPRGDISRHPRPNWLLCMRVSLIRPTVAFVCIRYRQHLELRHTLFHFCQTISICWSTQSSFWLDNAAGTPKCRTTFRQMVLDLYSGLSAKRSFVCIVS